MLVVDSAAQSRATTMRLVQECGFRVTAAATGREALELLMQGQGVDVCLKAHEPPHSNAVGFLNKLRELPDPRHRQLPVVGEIDERDREIGRRVCQGPGRGARLAADPLSADMRISLPPQQSSRILLSLSPCSRLCPGQPRRSLPVHRQRSHGLPGQAAAPE